MARPRRAVNCPRDPIGLSAEEAAAYIGVSERTFATAVEKGLMPQPRKLFGRLIWDVDEVRASFKALPKRGPTKPQGEAFDDDGIDWSDVA